MSITFYDNYDDMMDDLRRSMEIADSRVALWQSAIRNGDCFRQKTEYGFDIYGEVLEEAYREKHLMNYRFCRCYSEACPEGEMGDVHVSVITEMIGREEFNIAVSTLNGDTTELP